MTAPPRCRTPAPSTDPTGRAALRDDAEGREWRRRAHAGRAIPVLLAALALAGCAVQGYELGWQREDALAPLLGRPADALAGCRVAPAVGADAAGGGSAGADSDGSSDAAQRPGIGAVPGGACKALADRIDAMATALPPTPDAPAALGALCRAGACSYANAYRRRDVGAALVVPVFRLVTLRQARARFVPGPGGRWRLDGLGIADVPPPAYGPVRIGAPPPP